MDHHKKRLSTPKLPLALNPKKSKDVLAVLAERNQSIVPVGAWVEPASPHSSRNTAYTEAYITEKKLKEQARKKQEALKRFQRLAKHRVNKRLSITKKQQLQKSSEEAEEENDTVAMLPSDLAQLASKRTSVFPENLNGAGSAWLPPCQKLDKGKEDRENQNQLLQHALALKKTMKQARNQLASFKTISKKYATVFPHAKRESFSTHQEPDSEESSSITIDKKGKEKLFWQNRQGFSSFKEKKRASSRVQKAQFKSPLYAVIEEEQVNELQPQDTLPDTQDDLSEDQGDLLETQHDLTGEQSVELEAHNIEPHSQAVELSGQPMEEQVVETKAQAIERKVHVFKIELGAGNIEPEDGNMLEVQDILSPNQAFLPKDQSILPSDQNIPLRCQDRHFLRKDQHVSPQNQDIQPKCQDRHFLRKDQHVSPQNQDIQPQWQDQHFLREDQHVSPQNQGIQPKCQDQHFLRKDQHVSPQNQDIQPQWKDQHFLREDQHVFPQNQDIQPQLQDQHFLREDQHVSPQNQDIQPQCQNQHCILKDQPIAAKDQKSPLTFQHQHFLPSEHCVLTKDQHAFSKEQNTLGRSQDQDCAPRFQKVRFKKHYSVVNEKGRDDSRLASKQSPTPKVQDQVFPRDQNMFFEQPSSFLREVRVRDELPTAHHHHVNPHVQDHASPGAQVPSSPKPKASVGRPAGSDLGAEEVPRTQSSYSRQQPSVRTAERSRDMLLDGHQHLPAKHRRECSSRRQVYDKYQSGWNTEFQTPLGLQFEGNQEEDKKERQRRYLRYRRLFMDIEREKVKEQQRQKEYRKRIEKIKRKKEQQRYAEEQRILRMNFQEEPYPEEMSEMLAQLRLEEMKEAREKRQRREREYQRYLEALRVQIQDKMRLYHITLPPLCGCGPDFWDAHPNTCANNCIFYKNHRAYTRALYSVINSCDTPSWTLSLRAAIHNFASAYRRTLKIVYLESEINS